MDILKKSNISNPFNPIEGFVFFLVIAITLGLLATPYYIYALIPAIAIILLLILGHSPQLGYYLIVFLIPYDTIRGLSTAYKSLTISKLVGFFIVIFTLLHFIFHKTDIHKLKSNLWKWLLLFFIICIISALISAYPLTSLSTLQTIGTGYLFFMLTVFFISEKGFLKTLPIVIISSVTISSVLSIYGYIFNVPLFALNIDRPGTLIRAIGAARDPNVLIAMIIIAVPLLFYWFFSTCKLSEKLIAIGLFAVNLIAAILTYSRGGAFILAIILFLVLLQFIRRFRPKYLGFIGSFVLIASIIIIFFVPSAYWQRLKSVTDTTEGSISARQSYLHFGSEAFKENPIIGYGPGTFKEIYAQSIYAFQQEREKEAYARVAHNSYLEVLIGTGILGFTFFILILMLSLNNFYTARKRFSLLGNTKMVSLISAYGISFISILIYFLLLSNIHHKYFWMLMALSQIAVNLSQKSSEKEASSQC
jgi:putative inorganic carbon (hco3(-)) transporter